ncbi:MAG: HAD-IA family hydrolase [Clostridiales Family XIII bacterium]|jgi:pyrophosphatase PpaX|nr:HAD-IA family hydrolase [Clostridiales Family XIII bacterium]
MKDGHNNKIDTIIFDYDGTLVDTNEAVLESWQYAARKLLGHEMPYDELKASLGEPILRSAAYLFPGWDSDLVAETYREFHRAHFQAMIKPFPGVREMLGALKSKGYKLGITTNRMRRTTEIGLKQFDLFSYFDVIVTYGEAPKNKPAPEHIWFTLEKMDSSPDRAILIGDSQNDIIGGHNAGLVSVRVNWAVATDGGYGEKAAEPDYVIEAPQDLFAILDALSEQ